MLLNTTKKILRLHANQMLIKSVLTQTSSIASDISYTSDIISDLFVSCLRSIDMLFLHYIVLSLFNIWVYYIMLFTINFMVNISNNWANTNHNDNTHAVLHLH